MLKWKGRGIRAKQKIALAAVCGCLALSAASGMSYAYMTDTGSKLNHFTTGDVDIDVVETEWDAHPDQNNDGVKDPASDLVQGRVVKKDPIVVNHSSMPAWVFLQVQVPVRNVMLVENAPKVTDDVQLFDWTVNEGWKELVVESGSNTKTYLYGYETMVDPEASTNALFDSVKFKNVVEGQIGTDEALDIKVTGFGIQGHGFDTIESAWRSFDNSQKDSSMSDRPDHSNRKTDQN